MEANEYQCAMCQGVFTKAHSDEEAMAETQAYWPGVAQQDCAVVCDDCWEKIHPETHPEEYQDSLLDTIEHTYRAAQTEQITIVNMQPGEAIRKILAAYAIPPTLLGDVSNTNYDAGWQEREDAYKQRFFKRKK